MRAHVQLEAKTWLTPRLKCRRQTSATDSNRNWKRWAARPSASRGLRCPILCSHYCANTGIDSVLAWDQVEGLDQSRLVAAGLSLVRAADPTVRAGLTGAVAAIAQIGSLVLTAGQGRPLSASLLPEIHIAVVYRAHLIWSLEEALQLREVREASATVLITGPSRTADIEMTLTIGVHGPKELIVFIVD